MKEQEIIRKSDIIIKPWLHKWCLLINFIEFHLKMKMSIPSDINLESHTTKFNEIHSEKVRGSLLGRCFYDFIFRILRLLIAYPRLAPRQKKHGRRKICFF